MYNRCNQFSDLQQNKHSVKQNKPDVIFRLTILILLKWSMLLMTLMTSMYKIRNILYNTLMHIILRRIRKEA